MLNRLQLCVLTGLLSLAAMPVLGAENVGAIRDSPLRGDTTHIAQGVTRVTGVEVVQTEEGLELVLETAAGSERLVPLILPEGNDLVIDILDATLAFSIRNGVTEINPAPGISRVAVNRVDDNSIRVTITGENQNPSADVVPGRDDLVLSVTPQDTTAEQEPDEEIEVIATGERGTENDDYVVPDATTATRTDTPLKDIPQSIQVVPQQVIEDQQANSLEDALRNVSGVSTGDSFGDSTERFVIRGFAQDTTLVNGFRQGAFRQGFPSLDRLERIEVLKGPASILYGNLEPGGVVNLVTKKPLSEPFAETSIELGSFGLFQSSFDFSDAIDSGQKLLYRFNTSVEAGGNFRDFEQDTTRLSLAPSISWQIGKNTDLLIDFNYTTQASPFDRGIVAIGDNVADIPFDRIFQQPDDEYELEQFNASYQLEHRFNDKWKLRNSFSLVSSDTSNFTLDSIFIDDSGILEREFRRNEDISENYSLQTNVVGEFKTGKVEHQLLAGLDYDRSTGVGRQGRLPDDPVFLIDIFTQEADPVPDIEPEDLTSFVRDENVRADLIGIYLQDQISVGKQFKFLAGGRLDIYDQESIDFTEDLTSEQSQEKFSPRVGLVYQPVEPISFYASYSTSFNPDPFNSTTVDGEVLEPSTGTQYELGVKGEFLDGNLTTTLAFYQIERDNFATTDPDNPDFSIAAGEVRSRGIELDVAGEILPGWNVIAAYAYTDAEITEDNDFSVGNRLENVPENSASLWTTYQIQQGSLQGFGLGAGVFFVGDRQGDLDNTFTLPSYVRTDAALFYRQNDWQANLNFQNLFDVDYIVSSETFREFVRPGDPFTIIGSVSVRF
ncbi:TonB-dependent siderophore receptor [Pleurocapsa sp. CCALA 161]|uniref:TonB-dependent siderophore receptor n=1 Tax=Pleurocapsa sp. CCALA 161 TaxID=2107688 RepID=UPI000D0789ED|nr:TonB-dependent siderophore receptor [Pleurocapsa sp. CCALA 161]PSB07476.1 TonB-dependent siderophore receptor [Pleurocapsa sp. CCALA 161]